MSAVRDRLFNIFAATLRIGGRLLYPQPEDAPCRCDRDRLVMEPPHCSTNMFRWLWYAFIRSADFSHNHVPQINAIFPSYARDRHNEHETVRFQAQGLTLSLSTKSLSPDQYVYIQVQQSLHSIARWLTVHFLNFSKLELLSFILSLDSTGQTAAVE
jgi:hypothetical protein